MKHAVVLGATGAVGSALVRELLAAPAWASVTIFVRRPTATFAGARGLEKLSEHVMHVDHLEHEVAGELALRRRAQLGAAAAFCTLGVGEPSTVSRAELQRVDVGIAGAFARGCRMAQVPHFSLLTAVGANRTSPLHYLRVKGEIESLVGSLEFGRASFFRPSLLVTRTLRYGFKDRVSQTIFPRLSRFLPSRYREITVEQLASAMRINAEQAQPTGIEVLEHADFVRLAA